MSSSSQNNSMRAITQHRFGGPEVLELADIPRPQPLPTEIMVRVIAAGVNPVDAKTRAGGGMAGVLGEPPFVLGWDVAGVVEQVGFGVNTAAVGDAVFGMPWFPRQAGAYAEYVTAPARQFAHKPGSLSFVEAAGVPLAALTAWQALTDAAGVLPGQRVVITAAGGGVGHFAVQLARQLGAHVIAVARADKHDWLAALGADELIDYTAAPFEEQIADVDVVIDLLGDEVDSTSHRALAVLRPGGTLIAVPSGVGPELAVAAEQREIRALPFLVEPDGAALAVIAELFDGGELTIDIERVYPLEEAAAAHRHLSGGRTRGKIVLAVDES
ncbi:NADP-dependent oxidoreductase [Nocardia sp. NPDC060249]|uniref:NADP-dependent oxidoreductase n=1 Tax=Nocardia sp. NPDC060249 TaxID=3347082 RepID=UPI00365F21E5